MKGDIENVESSSSHLLFGANTFLSCPLESSYARIFDFVEVLNTLGGIDEQVRTSSFGTLRSLLVDAG